MATLEQLKENIIIERLLENGLNQSATAKELGISRGTLRKYVEKFAGTTNKQGKAVLNKVNSLSK